VRRRPILSATALVVLALVAALVAPAGATAASPAPAGRSLSLVLPLRADLGGLRRLALAVSTPGDPRYGEYHSIAWLARRFGARPAAERRVLAYLRARGARGLRLDATGLFVDARLRAAAAARLFSTRLAEFHAGRARFTAPTSPVTVPRPLRGLVTGVVGLDTRSLASGERLARAAAATPSSGYTPATGAQAGCAAGRAPGAFTPNQYLSAYGYAPLQAAGLAGQGERVALVEIDGFRRSDLTTYAHCFGLHPPKIDAFGVGVGHALAPGGEATLDLEVLTAAAPRLKAIDVYESGAEEASSLRALTAPLQNPGFTPQVISASLGLCEPEVYASVGRAGLLATEGALEEAAASGISFLSASGDTGSSACEDSSGAIISQLAVNYPASSWWATGVGGTNMVLTPTNALDAEQVWNDGAEEPGAAAGGGRSVFNRPSYQKGTVAGSHREVPDVSMLSDPYPGYAIYCTAQPDCVTHAMSTPWQGVGGTSAAAPLLAGGFAMIDQDLREHHRQDLGLANPLLYRLGRSASAASVFSDVLAGDNDVAPFLAGHSLGCCSARAGYDEASGWGSVRLGGLAAAALSLEPSAVSVTVALPGHQRPVAAGGIRATVGCSGSCLLAGFADLRIGRGQTRRFVSRPALLRSRGSRTVLISFGAAEETRLRSALRRHAPIVADVVGASVDPAGNVERRSSSRRIRISS
jgi:kumamolisin